MQKVFIYTRINGVETQKWVGTDGKVHTAVVGRVKPKSEQSIQVVEERETVIEEPLQLDTSFLEMVNANSRRAREENNARLRALRKEARRKEYAKKHPIKHFIKGLLK